MNVRPGPGGMRRGRPREEVEWMRRVSEMMWSRLGGGKGRGGVSRWMLMGWREGEGGVKLEERERRGEGGEGGDIEGWCRRGDILG